MEKESKENKVVVLPVIGDENNKTDIPITREEYTALLKEVSALRSGNAIVAKPKGKIATMKFIDDNPVVDFSPVRTTINNGKESLLFDVFLYDDKGLIKKKDINYLDFARNGDKREVTILRTDKEEITKEYGSVNVTYVDGYKTIFSGRQVPLAVTSEDYQSLIELPNGEKITVNNKCLNMV